MKEQSKRATGKGSKPAAPAKPPKKDPRDTQFKKGNSIWRLAQYPGAPRKFETARHLWEAACGYFEWAEIHPLPETIVSAGKKISMPKRRPFTLIDLCHHIGVSGSYLNNLEDRIVGKTDPAQEGYDPKEAEFAAVITHIKEVVFNQKYQGAAVGHFKENLIARDLGIHESVNNKLWSGNDEPLTSQITVFQIPDNGRPVTVIRGDDENDDTTKQGAS